MLLKVEKESALAKMLQTAQSFEVRALGSKLLFHVHTTKPAGSHLEVEFGESPKTTSMPSSAIHGGFPLFEKED